MSHIYCVQAQHAKLVAIDEKKAISLASLMKVPTKKGIQLKSASSNIRMGDVVGKAIRVLVTYP